MLRFLAFLAASLHCLQLQIVEPLVRWWEEVVLGTWESFVLALVRQAFEETTRALNAFGAWVLSLFSKQNYRAHLRRAWQENSWQQWWGEAASRPSTLNALVASLVEQQQRNPQEAAPGAIPALLSPPITSKAPSGSLPNGVGVSISEPGAGNAQPTPTVPNGATPGQPGRPAAWWPNHARPAAGSPSGGTARPAGRSLAARLERPVVFVQQSGMGILDELAKRRHGLIEDAKMAAQLAVSSAFELARSTIRALLLLPPRESLLAARLEGGGAVHKAAAAAAAADEAAESGAGGGGAASGGDGGGGGWRFGRGSGGGGGRGGAARGHVPRSKSAHINLAEMAYQPGAGAGAASSSMSRRGLRRSASYGHLYGSAGAHSAAADAPSDALSVIRSAGYPHELHTVTTADGYLLRMERIPRPGARDTVFLMHGVLDTSMAWISGGVTGSQAFAAWEAGMDVWLGNSRGNAPRQHSNPAQRGVAYWRYNINHMGMYDIAAQLDHIHNTKCAELGEGTVTVDLDHLGPLAGSFLSRRPQPGPYTPHGGSQPADSAGLPARFASTAAGAGAAAGVEADGSGGLAAAARSGLMGGLRGSFRLRASNSDGNLHRWGSTGTGGAAAAPAAAIALLSGLQPSGAAGDAAGSPAQTRVEAQGAAAAAGGGGGAGGAGAVSPLASRPPSCEPPAALSASLSASLRTALGSGEVGSGEASALTLTPMASCGEVLEGMGNGGGGGGGDAWQAGAAASGGRGAAVDAGGAAVGLPPPSGADAALAAIRAQTPPPSGPALDTLNSLASVASSLARTGPRSAAISPLPSLVSHNTVTLKLPPHPPSPMAPATPTTFTLEAKTRNDFGPGSVPAAPAAAEPPAAASPAPSGLRSSPTSRRGSLDLSGGAAAAVLDAVGSVLGPAADAVSTAVATAAASAGAAIATAAASASHLLQPSPPPAQAGAAAPPPQGPPSAAAATASPFASASAQEAASGAQDQGTGPRKEAASGAGAVGSQPAAPRKEAAAGAGATGAQPQPAALRHGPPQAQPQPPWSPMHPALRISPATSPRPSSSQATQPGPPAPGAAASCPAPAPVPAPAPTTLLTASLAAAAAPAAVPGPLPLPLLPRLARSGASLSPAATAAATPSAAPSPTGSGAFRRVCSTDQLLSAASAAHRAASFIPSMLPTPERVASGGASGGGAASPSDLATAAAVAAAAAQHGAAPPAPYKLRCVAHSLGGMSMLIHLVNRLRCGKPHHVARLVLLSPAGFHRHHPKAAKPVMWIFPRAAALLRALLGRSLAFPLFIPTPLGRALFFRLLLSASRIPGLGELLRVTFKALLDGDISQWDRALQMPHYSEEDMPAISLDQVLHLVQLVHGDAFRLYDYGSPAANAAHYGTPSAPDVSAEYWRLDMPVHLVAGSRDGIIPPPNVRRHLEAMRAQGVAVTYREFDFGHLDFTFGVKEEVRMYLMRLLRL